MPSLAHTCKGQPEISMPIMPSIVCDGVFLIAGAAVGADAVSSSHMMDPLAANSL